MAENTNVFSLFPVHIALATLCVFDSNSYALCNFKEIIYTIPSIHEKCFVIANMNS